MIEFCTSESQEDLSGILDLQKINLAENLTEQEISDQGFVTVSHSLDDLVKMNSYEQHLLIKDGHKLIGYFLVMTGNSRGDIPVLCSLFDAFDRLLFKGKPISQCKYLLVGQVCIDQNYRGTGLFDKGYQAYKERFKGKYDFAITTISYANQRSLRAHKRVGFTPIHTYTDTTKTKWSIVAWEW